jgi:hypothetical protein
MATTEIEKLERRYAENPQGLTFAPLAEVHRKNGDVTRALELLKAGLELHPNYIPASIVLGRCHWDLGDLPAAESAFAHVLRLDDENVIALKSLADINEKLERFTEAQRWLNRLISIDRSNEEARQQLARLEAARQPRPASPVLPETSAPEPEPARREPPLSSLKPKPEEPPAPAPFGLTAELEQLPAASASDSQSAAKSESPALEFLDTSEPAAQLEKPPQVPPLAEEPAKPPAEEPASVEGLISQEFVPPGDSYRSHPELTKEFVEPTGSNEPGLDGLEVETAREVELQSSGASEFRVPNAAEDFMDAAFAAAISPPADLPAATPEVAELRPPSPPAAQSPLPDLELSTPTASPPPRRLYSARETKGQSVAAFFAALLGARPAGAANPQPTGAHQADTAPPGAAHPASPAGGPSPTAAGPSGDAAVSFDDLFGTAAEPSPTPKGSTDPGKEDLDQFQSWLQNLKR